MRDKPTKQAKRAFKLTPDQLKQWRMLVDAGTRRREAKGNGKHGRVDKNGGLQLNWDDDSHVRACAYLLMMSARRMRVKDAVSATGMDWIVMTTLKDHCQEFHDAYCAMLQAQKTRMRDNAAGLVDATMDGEDVSNAQGRMAAWALERLDEDYRPQPAQPSPAQQTGQLAGGIVINLIADAANLCDKARQTGATIDAELVPAKQIGHDDA